MGLSRVSGSRGTSTTGMCMIVRPFSRVGSSQPVTSRIRSGCQGGRTTRESEARVAHSSRFARGDRSGLRFALEMS